MYCHIATVTTGWCVELGCSYLILKNMSRQPMPYLLILFHFNLLWLCIALLCWLHCDLRSCFSSSWFCRTAPGSGVVLLWFRLFTVTQQEVQRSMISEDVVNEWSRWQVWLIFLQVTAFIVCLASLSCTQKWPWAELHSPLLLYLCITACLHYFDSNFTARPGTQIKWNRGNTLGTVCMLPQQSCMYGVYWLSSCRCGQ